MRVLFLVVVVLVAAPMSFAAPAAAGPNILLLIADDMSWCHAGFAGDPAVRTPAIDRLAREGVVFTNAHCVAASCTPSRAALLTGRPIWELEEGANLWGTLPAKFEVYPDLLERAGYRVGFTGKGWGPGDFKPGGRTRNPAGAQASLHDLLQQSSAAGQPFCFWMGSHHPHRPYPHGSGAAVGIELAKVRVPPTMPDVPEVRGDIADYLCAIQQFDAEVAEAIGELGKAGRLDDTLVVLTSDNGMPFPRGKATLYEYGTHMPLIVRWPAKFNGGRTIDGFVSLMDLAPTFLEAAGVAAPAELRGRSLMPLLTSGRSGQIDPARDHIILGNERHADVRAGHLAYPRRAIRTGEFLYVRNLEPDRWPAGDPPRYGDIDPARRTEPTASAAKDYMIAHREDPAVAPLFDLAFGKRPAEELYDLRKDPRELHDVAQDPTYAAAKKQLKQRLAKALSSDPRSNPGAGRAAFDQYPYYGAAASATRRRGATTAPATRDAGDGTKD